ncbi:MAG: DegQ family serine endoprotease [Pyrinomonadaceae bacterium]|nr:DegQ family serine endoprotease [Pyrinomonadaceae bacterium]
MIDKFDKRKHAYKFAILILLSTVFISGCTTDFFGRGGAPAAKEETEPKSAPPVPVIVDGIRTSYADLVEKATPAVVQITSTLKNARTRKSSSSPFDEFFKQLPQRPQNRQPRQGFGSGVLVSEDGTILTNHHVVKNADKITIETNDNKTYEAKVVGMDPPSDLAVLKIEGEKFPFLKLGDSDSVRVGDIVLAIGNPLGIGQSVTSGIISAKGRQTGVGDGSFEDFLQTDAPINRGNSGGALINLSGELVGINSQILSTTGGSIGIGFAIPSNMSKSVMEQLIENGKVRRGMLGVDIQNINSDIAKKFNLKDANGVLVSNVRKDSAAEKAGIKRGDLITAVNGEKVDDGNALRNKVAGTLPGTEITLSIVRDGKEQEIKSTLGEFDLPNDKTEEDSSKEAEDAEQEESGKLGLNLQPLTPETAAKLKIPEEVKGVLVTGVDPNSPAGEKGIMRGDVIIEINRELVSTLEEVRRAISKSDDKSALLLISRGGRTFFVLVKPKSGE